MIILWYGIFFFMSLGLAYFFNNKLYTKRSKLENLLMSLIESLIILAVLLMTGLVDFIFSLTMFWFLLFGALGLGYLRVRKQQVGEENSDELLEVIKNSLILFMITVYPFFVFLTIFKYLPFFVQIPLSLLLAFLFYYSSTYIQKYVYKWYKKLSFKFDLSGSRKWWLLFSVIVISGFMVLAFDFPEDPINNALNLNNHQPIYGITKGYDYDVQTNYESRLVKEVIIASNAELPYDDLIVYPEDDNFFYGDNGTQYSSRYQGYTTYYTKETPGGDIEEVSYQNYHNVDGVIIGDVIYLVSFKNPVIEIMDGEFGITHIYNVQETEAFLYNNGFYNFELYFRVVDEKLHYIQVESRDGYKYISEYELYKEPVDIELPFYSHYSFINVLLMVGFLFVPITDYKSFTTVVDFDHAMKKEKK